MKLHNLLQRQLNRYALNADTIPKDIQQWQAFLERVNNFYHEIDQERYLLERSMEISSREMYELNNRLEKAQHIAGMGYWSYDQAIDKITLSKELRNLFGFNPDAPTPNYEQFLQLVHPDDKEALAQKVQHAFTYGLPYEYEMRVINPRGEYRWFRVVGQPDISKGKPYTNIYGITMDINRNKLAEAEIARLHQELITAARQAGMADVATAILHNVGNILNSANVSISLLRENVNSRYYNKLSAVMLLVKEHADSLVNYLTHDEKGRLVPEYLIKLAEVIGSDRKLLANEVNNLTLYIQHIREIVAMQQSISGLSGIMEKIFLPEALDIALKMASTHLEDQNIVIVKNYAENIFTTTDKSKLLQILVNLIKNAKDAIIAAGNNSLREITLSITKAPEDNKIQICVKDTGIGIAPENKTKIFSFGFTTKEKGHGFGLHSSALAAKEIGGKLQVTSDGIGRGTTFTLSLPLD